MLLWGNSTIRRKKNSEQGYHSISTHKILAVISRRSRSRFLFITHWRDCGLFGCMMNSVTSQQRKNKHLFTFTTRKFGSLERIVYLCPQSTRSDTLKQSFRAARCIGHQSSMKYKEDTRSSWLALFAKMG